ncbi:MAG: hypothetical protein EON56_03900 [Alphaproteobacteria bacterium]|nr:MAG: hypothetical protein EON56_03900 [Alphaproteobacteria bacterium]
MLLDEFNKFAHEEPDLIREMKEIDRLAKAAKTVRDGLAHKRIFMGMGLENGGNYLRFESDNVKFPWSKPYSEHDLIAALNNISAAAGRLFRLTNIDHPTSVLLPGKSLLRRLPDMDLVRFPVPASR